LVPNTAVSVGSAIKADFDEVNKSVVWLIENYVNVPVLCKTGSSFTYRMC
jgi:hypothetical protein